MTPAVKTYRDNDALVDGLNERSDSAVEKIFHRLYPSLCYFADKFIGNSDATRDVVLEVFVQFYEKREVRFQSLAGAVSFLYRAVHNGAIDYLRRNKRTVRMTSQEYGAEELAYAEPESVVFMKIFEAIEHLPEKMREIFVLSYVDRLSVREISSRLGIAETTVKTQRQRARQQLKARLKDYIPLLSLLFF